MSQASRKDLMQESGCVRGYTKRFRHSEWKNPATYLDTVDGEELVALTLQSMETGAYR